MQKIKKFNVKWTPRTKLITIMSFKNLKFKNIHIRKVSNALH
jgi:hypothetical protein